MIIMMYLSALSIVMISGAVDQADDFDLILPPPGVGDPLLLGRPGLPGLHKRDKNRIESISFAPVFKKIPPSLCG